MHEAYIRQAIESILSQDVDFSIELVIGEDCSSDRTRAVCEEIAERDKRVRLLQCERNLGATRNFTLALLACEGEYIALCEGDDYWTDPQKLRKQVKFLDGNPDYAGAAHQAITMRDGVNIGTFKENVPSVIRTENLIQGRLFHTASFLFRRPAIDLFINSPPVLSCDRLLNFCVSFLGKIKYSKESMCVFRVHDFGLSNTATIGQMKQDLLCIPYLSKIYPEFPRFQYLSYVYATIGLKKFARLDQKIYYFILFFIYSFSRFPDNLFDMYKYIKRKFINKFDW
jgi:glycosyltransferase involved in cell wall biosynthesis